MAELRGSMAVRRTWSGATERREVGAFFTADQQVDPSGKDTTLVGILGAVKNIDFPGP